MREQKYENRLAVFASGSGSNFQSIINAVEDEVLNADISLISM